MSLTEQWQQAKREIETALTEGRMDADAAAKALAHLDYRIKRRPRILKRRQDRKAWRKAQALKLLDQLAPGNGICRNSEGGNDGRTGVANAAGIFKPSGG